MHALVVTASNDAYMPLCGGLLMSLKRLGILQIGCLDVGLSEQNRNWIAGQVTHIVKPRWDLPVAAETRENESFYRAMTARPFLPAYFPGYDLYIWIDADAWVQERFVFDYLFAAAEAGALAIVPELDRAYRQERANRWRVHRLTRYYSAEAASHIVSERYYNSGVFALRGDAPHWSHWRKHFLDGLVATRGELVCDQTALNYAIWADSLPVAPLPASCNWLCHLAFPNFDPALKKFHEPCVPHSALGVLHLVSETKDVCFTLQGSLDEYNLRFPWVDELI